MILPRFFIAAVLGLAACQSAPLDSSAEILAAEPLVATTTSPSTRSAPAIITSSSIAAAAPTSTTPRNSAQTRIVQLSTLPPTDEATTHWLETEMNSVRLGMWAPDGWMTDVSEGLLLAEMNDDPMTIYCFVPLMSEFHLASSDNNDALDVLNQVVNMPNHTGPDMKMSEPVSFQWDNHQAAYYMLSGGDGARMLVLALDVPNQRQVVVCNLWMEVGDTTRIRAALPALLDGLTINGTSLRGEALDALPDPLRFPRYYQMSASSGR